jgi:hypothetical protein
MFQAIATSHKVLSLYFGAHNWRFILNILLESRLRLRTTLLYNIKRYILDSGNITSVFSSLTVISASSSPAYLFRAVMFYHFLF